MKIHIELEKLLAGRTLYWLSKETSIRWATLAEMAKGGTQRLETRNLSLICGALKCEPGDLLTLRPINADKSEQSEAAQRPEPSMSLTFSKRPGPVYEEFLKRSIKKSPPPASPLARGLKETAARIGVSTSFVRKAIDAGELRSVRVGRRVLVKEVDLLDWLNSGDQASASTASIAKAFKAQAVYGTVASRTLIGRDGRVVALPPEQASPSNAS